jgi:hypothetical protein
MKYLKPICLGLLLTGTPYVAGCTRPTDKTPIVINADEGEAIEKHSVDLRRNEKWEVARWFNCTATRISPLQVFFRVIGNRMDALPIRGVALLQLRSTESDELIKQVESKLLFEACANMKTRIERSYDDSTQTWGKEERFPPPGPCWEASVITPFGSVKNRGTYRVLSELTLDDGSVFQFDPIEFSILAR